MTQPKKKRKLDKRKPKRRQSPTFREPDSDYLREVLGHIDVALWVDQTPLYGKSETATIGDKRVCFQPELGADDEEAKRQENSSRRFKRFWATLTLAQKEALRMIYVNNPSGLTKVQVAEMLGIRVDTLQERIDSALKKLRKFFPEYGAD